MTQLNALMLARGKDTIVDSVSISVATDYNLSSAVRQGQAYLILNDTANSSILTIKSSDGDSVETIRTGYCYLIALQNSPTDATHWKVIDVYENGTWTPVLFFASLGTASVATSFAQFTRRNKLVSVGFQGTVTKGTASGAIQIRGLPYSTPTSPNQPMSASFGAITIPAQRQVVGHFANNSTVTEYVLQGGATEVGVGAGDLAASTELRFNGSYHKA